MRRRLLSECGQNCLILLFAWLMLLLPLQHSPAQSYFDRTDNDDISYRITSTQQAIRGSFPARVITFASGDIRVDGVMMPAQQLFDTLNVIISNLPARGTRVTNPAPDRLGPLWDFEIIDAPINPSGSQCQVTCTYRLTLTGTRTAPGVIELEKTNPSWRIIAIDGLVSFLAQELQTAPPKRIPANNRPPVKVGNIGIKRK